MSKIEIEVGLTGDDRKLLAEVVAIGKKIVGKAGAAPAGKKTPPKSQASDDDFDNAGDGDGEGEGEGEEAGEGEGEEAGEGEGEAAEATRDDVQAALRAYAAVTSKAKAMELLKKDGGSDALSKLKEAKFQTVIDAANAATKKAKAAKK